MAGQHLRQGTLIRDVAAHRLRHKVHEPVMVRQKDTLEPARFGEFDLDPQFDLGQNRVEAGIAG